MDPSPGWAPPDALGRIVSPELLFIEETLAPEGGPCRRPQPTRSPAGAPPDPFPCKLPVIYRPREFGAYGSGSRATPAQIRIEPPYTPRYRAELPVSLACK